MQPDRDWVWLSSLLSGFFTAGGSIAELPNLAPLISAAQVDWMVRCGEGQSQNPKKEQIAFG
jgi:hypothetical protein